MKNKSNVKDSEEEILSNSIYFQDENIQIGSNHFSNFWHFFFFYIFQNEIRLKIFSKLSHHSWQ